MERRYALLEERIRRRLTEQAAASEAATETVVPARGARQLAAPSRRGGSSGAAAWRLALLGVVLAEVLAVAVLVAHLFWPDWLGVDAVSVGLLCLVAVVPLSVVWPLSMYLCIPGGAASDPEGSVVRDDARDPASPHEAAFIRLTDEERQ